MNRHGTSFTQDFSELERKTDFLPVCTVDIVMGESAVLQNTALHQERVRVCEWKMRLCVL